jgi:hypothetical protein
MTARLEDIKPDTVDRNLVCREAILTVSSGKLLLLRWRGAQKQDHGE